MTNNFNIQEVLASRAIANKARRWVNVEDELPEYETRVLTIDGSGVQRVLVCDRFEDMVDWYDEEWGGLDDSLDVKYWMKLPESPEDKGKY